MRAKVGRQNGRVGRHDRAGYRAVTAVILSRFDWDHPTSPSYRIPVEWIPIVPIRYRVDRGSEASPRVRYRTGRCLAMTVARPMSLLAEVRGPVVRHA